MKKIKFKKITEYHLGKNFGIAFLVLTIISWMANGWYLAYYNNGMFNNQFFPIGFLLITLLLSIIIAIFLNLKKETYYEKL